MSTAAGRLRDRLFDPYNPRSLAARARRAREHMMLERFPELSTMRVLDLGGTPASWESAHIRPAKVVTLNIDDARGPDWVETISGDACDPPASLRSVEFDLVFSNSVIEHVGGRWRRLAFARTVHELAPHHWIQTPARSFPLEPHWLFPGFQFLPVQLRTAISARWKFSHIAAGERDDDPLDEVLSVELISRMEFERLFPRSAILSERAVGLTKSLIAVL